ncbi:MAG: Ig-like domain-containing protein [Bacilli bacterium]
MKKMTNYFLGLIMGLMLTIVPTFLFTNVQAEQLDNGAGDISFTYVPTGKEYIDVTTKIVDGRTIFDVTNKLGSSQLSASTIEDILAQNAGNGATKFSIYATINNKISNTGKYKDFKYVGDDSEYTFSKVEKLPILDDVVVKPLNYSFWPFEVKLVYRLTETSPWQYTFTPKVEKKTLKEQLSEVLNKPINEIISLYNVLYRFESAADGTIMTHQHEFYDLEAGKQPVANPNRKNHFYTTNLVLLGIETYEIHYHNLIKVSSVTLNKEALTMSINDTEVLSTAVLPANAPYQKVKYSSDEPTVVSVDNTGKITALSKGTAIITSSSEGKSDTLTITVRENLPVDNKLPANVDKIIENSKNNDVTFDLNTPVNLDNKIFENAKKNNTTVSFNVVDNSNKSLYSWEFDSTKLGNVDPNLNLDLSLTVSNKAPANTKTDLTDILKNEKPLFLNFAHHGELPGPASMEIYVGNLYADGDVVTLYYVNETTNKTEVLAKNLVVKKGYVEFTITHCSTYVLTKNPIVKNPQTGDINLLLISLVGILGLCGSAYTINKLRKN